MTNAKPNRRVDRSAALPLDGGSAQERAGLGDGGDRRARPSPVSQDDAGGSAAERPRRVAVYVRTSGERGGREARAGQRRAACDAIAGLGISPAHALTFHDHGPAHACADRPGLQRALRAIQSREIRVLALESVDRLSRDQSEIARIFAELEAHGVGLVAANQGLLSRGELCSWNARIDAPRRLPRRPKAERSRPRRGG